MFVLHIFPVKMFTIIYLKFSLKLNKHFFVLSEQILTTALYLLNEEINTIICAKYIFINFLSFVLFCTPISIFKHVAGMNNKA